MAKFGVRSATWKELVQEAGKALFDAAPGMNKADVDSLFVGAAEPERLAFQSHVAPLAAEQLGIQPWRMVQRVELACASGQAAIRSAWLAVATGLSDVALVIGVEKMNIPDPAELQTSMACVLDREWDGVHGASAPPFFAMCAQRHMHEYGTTRDHLTAVRLKAGKYGQHNPMAHYPRFFPKEKIEASPMIAPPLRLLDCSGITDGAAAVLVTSADRARQLTEQPLHVWGGAQAVEGHNLASLQSWSTWLPCKRAAQEAYKLSGITARDVDVAQVHDCFTISEIIVTEDLGFCEKGKGGAFIAEGQTEIGGEVAINTDGGLLARGHPIGATGVAQAVELLAQVQGKAGPRQAPDPDVLLAHNLSGSANAHSIMVYGRQARRGSA
jgi:acetyl-CoA C-acetyltransferase